MNVTSTMQFRNWRSCQERREKVNNPSGVGEISGTVAVTDFSLILSDNVTEGLA